MTASAPTARVITVSTRAAAGVYADRSGPVAVEGLVALGFDVDPPIVVPDGPATEAALRAAVDAGIDVVLTAGGTGLSVDDRTPEATRGLLTLELPGVSEALRAHGKTAVPTAVLSRGLAGLAGRTLVVNLPGSVGGVRDGMAVLGPLLGHAVRQLHGHDDHHDHDHHHDDPAVAGEVVHTEVTDAPIEVSQHEALVSRTDAGAVAGFGGVVRDHDADRKVAFLEYTAHPSAARVLADVANEAAARPGMIAVAVSHRLGELGIGDVALACAVSAAHRSEAFDGCRWLVDQVKRRLPVWKRQVFVDGTEEWVNCP